ASGKLRPLSRKPGDNVGNFLGRHGLAGNIVAPIGCARVGTPNDDESARFLIGGRSEEGAVADGAGFGAAFATWAMAGRAEGGVDGSAARGVTVFGGGVRRKRDACESVGLGVTFADPVDDDVDLIVGEHATSAFGKGGHGGASDAVSDDFAESGIVDDGEIDRITERKSRAVFGFGTVTARTVFLIEEGEVGDVVRVDG